MLAIRLEKLLKEQEEQIKKRDESLEKAREEIKWLRGMLKEQEAVEPTSYMDGLVQRYTCGKCGKHLLYAKWGRDDFCSKCGQAVKWE